MRKYGHWYWIRPWLLCRDRSAAARRCACFIFILYNMIAKKKSNFGITVESSDIYRKKKTTWHKMKGYCIVQLYTHVKWGCSHTLWHIYHKFVMYDYVLYTYSLYLSCMTTSSWPLDVHFFRFLTCQNKLIYVQMVCTIGIPTTSVINKSVFYMSLLFLRVEVRKKIRSSSSLIKGTFFFRNRGRGCSAHNNILKN